MTVPSYIPPRRHIPLVMRLRYWLGDSALAGILVCCACLVLGTGLYIMFAMRWPNAGRLALAVAGIAGPIYLGFCQKRGK